MILYLVAVNLLPHAHHNPESAIAYALDGILTPGMLASIRRRASLATTSLHPWPRWSLPDDNTPDESAFPPWPVRTER